MFKFLFLTLWNIFVSAVVCLVIIKLLLHSAVQKEFDNLKNKSNIVNADFLEFKFERNFDLIIGNPPYFVIPKKSVNKNLVLGKLKNRLVNNGPVLGQYGGPNLGMPTNNLGMPQSIAPAPGNYSERPQNPITAGIIASAGSFQDRIPSGQNLGLMGPGLGGISRPGHKVKLGGPVRDGRREITNPKLLTKQPSDVSNNPPMQGGLGGVIVPNIGGRNRSLPNLPKGNAGPDSARSQGAKGGKN